MAITAGMVKELREKTGLPMMECKKALTESNGDIDQAIEYLKQAGSAKIEKMASRETSQGRIAAYVTDGSAGLAQVLCETAPVANTDDFIALCGVVAQVAASLEDPTDEAVLAAPCPDDSSKTVKDMKEEVFNRLRENMNIKTVTSLKGNVASYVHHNAQVGVIVQFSGECPEDVANGVCMHIAAMNPPFLKREDVKGPEVEEARAQYEQDAKGKPAEIAEKIITGKMDRFYSEIVLLEQPFVIDDKVSVGNALKAASPDLTVTAFIRSQIGS